MDNQSSGTSVAVLAGYLEGRKDGFVAGIAVTMSVLVLWRAYRRDRSGFTNWLIGTKQK